MSNNLELSKFGQRVTVNTTANSITVNTPINANTVNATSYTPDVTRNTKLIY